MWFSSSFFFSNSRKRVSPRVFLSGVRRDCFRSRKEDGFEETSFSSIIGETSPTMPFLKRETKTFLRKMLGALEGGAGVRIREREKLGERKRGLLRELEERLKGRKEKKGEKERE